MFCRTLYQKWKKRIYPWLLDQILTYDNPSSASRYPGLHVHAGFPAAVVMHSCSHLVPSSQSLFCGQLSSSSPSGQSFCPSQMCLRLTQERKAVLTVLLVCALHMNWPSSQETSHFISSSPLEQSGTPSHTQVNCGGIVYVIMPLATTNNWRMLLV